VTSWVERRGEEEERLLLGAKGYGREEGAGWRGC